MRMGLSKKSITEYSTDMHRTKIFAPSKIELADSLVLEGDVTEALPRLPSQSVQCVVTSPPYWGLRDYGIKGQIGLESTLAGYINKLTNVFAEVRRVLKPDGILWLNIGDSFTSGNRGWRAPDKKNPNRAMSVRPDNPPGLKDKDLVGVPWRLAFALQADGWFLRSDIIWHKPNAMPESVKDRPTRAHEYLFMLTKEERYSYASDAVMEDADDGGKRNCRSVWSINTAPTNGSHIAGFPQELVEPCILASTKPDDFVFDPFFGCGTVGLVAIRMKRKFIGVELNSTYLDDAMHLLKQQSQTAEPLRRHMRHPTKQNGHHPTLLETPSKRRNVS
jgi:site-specific DNA-methyltransferase (adenine-specific)